MNSTPGSHVVLVGAGVSRSSGIRTAWQVLTEEAARLAGLYSEEDVAAAEADIEGWYQEKFGKPLRYEELLEELAPKQLERQQRLRNYFEPSAEDWEAGRRQPTAAHRALAELVAGGFVVEHEPGTSRDAGRAEVGGVTVPASCARHAVFLAH